LVDGKIMNVEADKIMAMLTVEIMLAVLTSIKIEEYVDDLNSKWRTRSK
jgi:hypothetical protein